MPLHAQGIVRQGRTAIVRYDSPDLVTWTRAEGILAEQFVSLGLDVRPGGALWITGIDHRGRADPAASAPTGPVSLAGFVLDGEGWRETRWTVDLGGAPAALDPQWHGDALWFVAAQGTVDPARPVVRNAVVAAPPGAPVFEAEGVTDPAPVRFGDQELLLVTLPGRVEVLAGQPLRQVHKLPGVTVPYGVVVAGELWVLVQGNRNGRRQPLVTRTHDLRTWTDPTPLLPPGTVGNCSSPVLGPLGDGWVLLCVDEDHGGGANRSPGPGL